LKTNYQIYLTCIARAFVALIFVHVVAGCGQKKNPFLQGYVEGEYVYVSSSLSGAVEKLYVQKGSHVNAGEPLFALENGAETALRRQTDQMLEEGRAHLNDLGKGKRPTEITSIEAQLNQNRAALALSEKEFLRQSNLLNSGAASLQEFDKSRALRDQDLQRVSQMEADLKTAELGSRVDQIAEAEANVHALEASLAKADWDLSQKQQSAPKAGMVFDTLFRVGEWVPAGRPVVALLPPENIKVRFFVPEIQIATVHAGDRVSVLVDGVRTPFQAKVSFISPQAEFTPPVIYSQESRGKLVFMIEAILDVEQAQKLHPGQPVDVQLNP